MTNAEPIMIDLEYPRLDGNPDTIILGLTDVRAADSMYISYDFDRDGYVIRMDRTHYTPGLMEVVEEAVTVAFIPAWLEAPDPEDDDGLTRVQADYFRTLGRMEISDTLRVSIELTKNQMRKDNATKASEK